jgi:hypothetical protein
MHPVTPKDPHIYTFKGPPVKEGSEPIGDLPGVAVAFEGGGSGFYSMWKPNEDELAALNAGHCVLVGILNNGQPIFPMEISVAKSKDTILEYTPQG